MQPPLAALFLVVFDQKVGYKVTWQRAATGVDLDGVEYQSLPSGLHSVRNDIIYFINGAHAGISAFVQAPADASRRNANFVAVGALVGLSHGRLGRSWQHAASLRQLGEELAQDSDDKTQLESYWTQHGEDGIDRAGISAGRTATAADSTRERTVSNAATTILNAQTGDERDHPALAMPDLLDLFGPLIFPLHRAALLRKRILLVGPPPVQKTCNYVYNLSILASIPVTLDDAMLTQHEGLAQIKPLFNIGISDIPRLETSNPTMGWLACTTDGILGEKPRLWDIVVELSSLQISQGSSVTWPKIRTSDGSIVKATQRDLRRYQALRADLAALSVAEDVYHDDDDEDNQLRLTNGVKGSSLRRKSHQSRRASQSRDEADVVESVSWGAMAYNGFMWWASAGEEYAWVEDEARSDHDLVMELPEIHQALAGNSAFSKSFGTKPRAFGTKETPIALTAYFHRFTSQILQTLADIVNAADESNEDRNRVNEIPVNAVDFQLMGLDSWSEIDKAFVTAAVKLYFDRKTRFDFSSVTLCGVKVC